MRGKLLALTAVFATTLGCGLPPAPEGLNESTHYMIRHFYDEDAVFHAGLIGMLEWFDLDGRDLVDVEANEETANRFELTDLDASDVAHLPIEDPILVDFRNEEWAPRDMTKLGGAISVATLDCTVSEAERFVTRPDQDVVFEGEWETYSRSFQSERAEFLAAWETEEFTPFARTVTRSAGDVDSEVDSSLLLTLSDVDPAGIPIVGNIGEFSSYTDFRHGTFRISGRDVPVTGILIYTPSAGWGENGGLGLLQSFAFGLHFVRDDGTTIRTVAVWTEAAGSVFSSDSGLALSASVNKALKSSERLSDVCSGRVEVADFE